MELRDWFKHVLLWTEGLYIQSKNATNRLSTLTYRILISGCPTPISVCMKPALAELNYFVQIKCFTITILVIIVMLLWTSFFSRIRYKKLHCRGELCAAASLYTLYSGMVFCCKPEPGFIELFASWNVRHRAHDKLSTSPFRFTLLSLFKSQG